MLLVGIDWADDHHDVCLVAGDCQDPSACLSRFRIAHSVAGFESLHAQVSAQEALPEQVFVAIETPHGLLVHELLRRGYCVYALNPKSVSRYRERHCPASAKDDGRDAFTLAHILRTDKGRFSPLTLLPDNYRLLEPLCRDLRQMVDDRTQVLNRLTACLKAYYPQALGLFSRLDAHVSIAFLRAYPDPQSLQALSPKRLAAFLRREHYTHPGRAEQLYQAARAAVPPADAVVTQANRLRLRALLDQLVPLLAHIRAYERQIQALFDALPESEHIANLPGVGGRLGPELLATLGPQPPDGTAPISPEGLQRLAGAAPVTRQSGRYKQVRFRRACRRPLRRTLHDWAQSALHRCRWAQAYYAYALEHGQRYHTILRNLACKLLAILHRLWRTGEAYVEERHIENLKAHNVVWAAQL